MQNQPDDNQDYQYNWPKTVYRTKEQWLAYADTCGHAHLAKAIRDLVEHDFIVLESVDDVDGSLIDYWFTLAPEQRLTYSTSMGRWIEETRLVDP